jgi:hypothetical protein
MRLFGMTDAGKNAVAPCACVFTQMPISSNKNNIPAHAHRRVQASQIFAAWSNLAQRSRLQTPSNAQARNPPIRHVNAHGHRGNNHGSTSDNNTSALTHEPLEFEGNLAGTHAIDVRVDARDVAHSCMRWVLKVGDRRARLRSLCDLIARRADVLMVSPTPHACGICLLVFCYKRMYACMCAVSLHFAMLLFTSVCTCTHREPFCQDQTSACLTPPGC